MPGRPAWLSWAGAAGGLVAVLTFLAGLWKDSGEFPGLPARVTAVERNQQEMGRRIDTMTSDINSMRKEMDSNQRRTEDNLNAITKSLAAMSGVMQDVRDQGTRAASELAAVKEKAVNAAILADEASRLGMEAKAKWEAEHQPKKNHE